MVNIAEISIPDQLRIRYGRDLSLGDHVSSVSSRFVHELGQIIRRLRPSSVRPTAPLALQDEIVIGESLFDHTDENAWKHIVLAMGEPARTRLLRESGQQLGIAESEWQELVRECSTNEAPDSVTIGILLFNLFEKDLLFELDSASFRLSDHSRTLLDLLRYDVAQDAVRVINYLAISPDIDSLLHLLSVPVPQPTVAPTTPNHLVLTHADLADDPTSTTAVRFADQTQSGMPPTVVPHERTEWQWPVNSIITGVLSGRLDTAGALELVRPSLYTADVSESRAAGRLYIALQFMNAHRISRVSPAARLLLYIGPYVGMEVAGAQKYIVGITTHLTNQTLTVPIATEMLHLVLQYQPEVYALTVEVKQIIEVALELGFRLNHSAIAYRLRNLLSLSENPLQSFKDYHAELVRMYVSERLTQRQFVRLLEAVLVSVKDDSLGIKVRSTINSVYAINKTLAERYPTLMSLRLKLIFEERNEASEYQYLNLLRSLRLMEILNDTELRYLLHDIFDKTTLSATSQMIRDMVGRRWE